MERTTPVDVVTSTRTALLSAAAGPAPMFDPATLDGLPGPARRYLGRALPDDVALSRLVELEMEGEIRLGGRWLPFTACQVLAPGVGFVWAAKVGGHLVRFVGADALGPDVARIEFRFQGRIPVVRGAGPDIRRSAQGRLAAETVVWAPQALTPQAGARWAAVDDERAAVTLNSAGTDVEVEIAVDDDGALRWLGLQRWKDSARPPGYAPFGGNVESTSIVSSGLRIAGSGTVGWDWRTPHEADGLFFRYRITGARIPQSVEQGERPS